MVNDKQVLETLSKIGLLVPSYLNTDTNLIDLSYKTGIPKPIILKYLNKKEIICEVYSEEVFNEIQNKIKQETIQKDKQRSKSI